MVIDLVDRTNTEFERLLWTLFIVFAHKTMENVLNDLSNAENMKAKSLKKLGLKNLKYRKKKILCEFCPNIIKVGCSLTDSVKHTVEPLLTKIKGGTVVSDNRNFGTETV